MAGSVPMLLPLIVLAALGQGGSAPAPQPAGAPHPPIVVYVPERVYDTGERTFVDLEVLLARAATLDVLIVGEQHGHPNTHRLQAAILDGLRRRGVAVTVSLEMFERDVQPLLDRYLAGSIPEPELLAGARPWPRYTTDYRRLVEMAKSEGWPVLAAGAPRPHAAAVAKSGQAALDELPAGDRAMVARELRCPEDAYFERFAAAMGGHAGTGAAAPGSEPAAAEAARRAVERYYWSQCLKDETMAESIAGAVERRKEQRGTVVHFTGAFHAEFGGGTTERVRRRLPGLRVAVVSILPAADIDAVAPAAEDLSRAEYLLYTTK